MTTTSCIFGHHRECGHQNERVLRTHEMLEVYKGYCDKNGFEYTLQYFDDEVEELRDFSEETVEFVDDPEYL